MFEMVDIDHVEVILQVVDRIIGLINKNSRADVTIDGLPGRTFMGKVMAISPKADPKSRTFLVKLVIDNRDGDIKAAMVARATIKKETEAVKVVVVPKDAVVMRNGKRAVFIDSGEGTVRELVVQTGKETGDYVEILSSNIKEGDMLVVTGNEILRNGSAINVVGEKNYGKTG
jgi:RND family efflux transporter MFP subunit